MNTPSSERTWFLTRDGQQFGPISELEFSTLANELYFRPHDLLWRPGLSDWVQYQALGHETPQQQQAAPVACKPAIPLKYRAFLSYSHIDEQWAKWLHARLEKFRIDKDLAGNRKRIRKSLRPIFRDRSDFTAGHHLSAQTTAALENSETLIVLCSPSSARSEYVNEEIARFKQHSPQRQIIPVIVGNNSDRSDRECFPPALSISPPREDALLAADLREGRDGRELGLAKIVASLLQLETDDVYRRAERYRRRQKRARKSIAAVLVLLTMAATASAFMFHSELKRNEALLDRTLERATTLVNKTVAMSEDYGLPRSLSLGFLTEAERMFTDMADLGAKSTKLILRKARMYVEFARTYEILGQSDEQLQRANEALHLVEQLLQIEPTNDDVHWLHLTALSEVGDALRIRGSLEQAYAKYVAALGIAKAAYNKRPTIGAGDAIRIGLMRLGYIDALTGNMARALETANLVLTISEALSQTDDPKHTFKRAVSAAHTSLGDLFLANGNQYQALEHQRSALNIDKQLAELEPNITSFQADLAVSYERLATLLGIYEDFEAALEYYKASNAIVQKLIVTDPRNTGWRSNECSTMAQIGDYHLALGQFASAKSHYDAAFAKMQPLAKFDPANVAWQFQLAALHFRLALAEALSSDGDFRRGVETARALNAFKNSVKDEDISAFRALTLSAFNKTGSVEARVQLRHSADILGPLIASNRLPPSVVKMAEIFRAANAALALEGK